jgi:heme/copper-type cytochrome/quinol oxidase subunit 2
MGKRATIANKIFLFSSMVFMIVVLLTVAIFLYLAFRMNRNKEDEFNSRYEIVLGNSTIDKPVSLYVNDSLLFKGTPASQLTLTIDRFAKESGLLVVDGITDVVTVYTLPEKSAKITIEKSSEGFGFDEKLK